VTAPTAAPAAGAVVLPALRAAPQSATDRFAFAAMLDSLPGAAAKAGSAAAEEGSRTSNDARQGEAPQPDGRPMLGGGAFLSGLSFALPSALATDEPAAAAVDPPASMKGASLGANGAAAATVEPVKPVAARLTGERAFHLALATSALVGAGPPMTDAPSFAPAPAAGESGNRAPASSPLASLPMQAGGLAHKAASSEVSVSSADDSPSPGAAPATTRAPAPVAPRGAGSSTNPPVSPVPATAQDPVRGGRKAEAAAAPSVPRAASPAAASAKAEPSGKAANGVAPDPAASAGQPAPQASPFGAPPAPSGAAGPSFGPFDAPAAGDVAPRASAPAAQALAAPPVKEIDVDLSPAGLEDVSMTMRLAGDRLSVVIHAASSQTAGSIEGARDAIADRLAAIGQPLDSLIVRQTGANTDANANGYGASSDEGSTSGESQAGSAGGQDGSGDAGSSRRGAGRDRGF
jgi:flagellar hook-length control protein FliK